MEGKGSATGIPISESTELRRMESSFATETNGRERRIGHLTVRTDKAFGVPGCGIFRITQPNKNRGKFRRTSDGIGELSGKTIW